MEIKELEEFAAEESVRLTKHYLAGYDLEKRILHATVKLNEEAGELSEAVLKELKAQRKVKLSNHDSKDLGSEIADVMICATIVGRLLDVNVEEALEEKIKAIKSRHQEEEKDV